jgi:hypothetical protein
MQQRELQPHGYRPVVKFQVVNKEKRTQVESDRSRLIVSRAERKRGCLISRALRRRG